MFNCNNIKFTLSYPISMSYLCLVNLYFNLASTDIRYLFSRIHLSSIVQSILWTLTKSKIFCVFVNWKHWMAAFRVLWWTNKLEPYLTEETFTKYVIWWYDHNHTIYIRSNLIIHTCILGLMHLSFFVFPQPPRTTHWTFMLLQYSRIMWTPYLCINIFKCR